MDVDGPSLDKSDAISHLMNGYCANHISSACTEVSRNVRSPVEMAVAMAEMVIDGYAHGKISLEHIRIVCSAVGIKSGGRRPEGSILVRKLKLRCTELQPLLKCADIESTFGVVETLCKRSLRQLAIQHQLNVRRDDDDDNIRTRLVDHLSSGSCQTSGFGLCASVRGNYHNTSSNDLEIHVLEFAAKKGSVTKKALKRILKCRNIEFDEEDGIGTQIS